MLKRNNNPLLVFAYVILILFFGSIAVGILSTIGLIKLIMMIIVIIAITWSILYVITH